jgi:hypothetical protein
MARSENHGSLNKHPHEDPRISLAYRVAASESFRRSTRLKTLLLHLCDRAFHGHPEDLTEQQVGMVVFGKPADYDSANENVVRVTARQLRLKLQEFFDAEGRGEPNVIIIPKGSYIPEIRPRIQTAAPHSAAPHSLDIRPPAPRNIWMWIALATGLLSLVAGWIAYSKWQEAKDLKLVQQPIEPGYNLLKSTVLIPGQRTLFVVGDPNLGRFAERTGSSIGLDDYLNHNIAAFLAWAPLSRDEKMWWENLLSRPQTDAASLAVASRALQANPDSVQLITVQHAAEVRAPEFRASNVLLIGTPLSNPWIELVTAPFNFQIFYDSVKKVTAIRNREPKAGEQAQYSATVASKRAVRFAHIAMRPNLNRSGSMLLLSGTDSEAVNSAAEFACARESVARLCSIAGIDDLQ